MLTRDELMSGRRISPDATKADLERLIDYDVLDSDFDDIGKVSAIWVDRTSQVAFVGVHTSWLAGKTHVAPAQGATVNDRDQKIRLAYSKADIKNAPVFDPKVELNYANESEIVSYYRKKGPALPELKGVSQLGSYMASTGVAGSAAAAAAPSLEQRESAPREMKQREDLNEANIPLHEELLKVSKREVGGGMIRIHKVIRTERVQQGVDLRHEEIVVERIPAKDLKVGAKAFEDEEFYIPLRQEEAVIEKEARVREQFHAHKAAKMEHKTVSEDLRKEDIEVINQEELRADTRSDQRSRR